MAIETVSQELVLVSLPTQTIDIDKELKKINGMIGDGPKCDVIIDFAKVEIITSSSISNLLILRGLLTDNQRSLILCSLKVPTKCIFTVAGLSDAFTFASNRTEALAAVHAGV